MRRAARTEDDMTTRTNKMMGGEWMVAAVLGLSALSGCAGASRPPITVVRQHDQGGEIALHGPIVASHHAAEDAMVEHCQGRVRVVAVVRGEEGSGAVRSTKLESVDVPQDAEHVHYVCVSRTARALAGR
jgi:hypothetical protein